MRDNTAIPKGVRVFPSGEAAQRRAVEERIRSVFRRWGFRDIITPTFEFLEVFEGAGPAAADRIFKFVDRQTGRLLALRPDVTPQVARMVATTLRHAPLPLRLSYATSVFRHEEAQAGRHREFTQLGVELIGLDRPEADAEMIAMAVEGCREAGLQNFQIDVGQAEYVRGLLDALGPAADLRDRLVSAIHRKDAVELGLLLRDAPGDEKAKEALQALPGLYGDKGTIEKAEGLGPSPRSRLALENLAQVVEVLEHYGLAGHVIIDLAETYALEYYTGVVFGAFSRGLGFPLGSGGRYDNLIGQFGYPCPATGFTFELDRVVAALEAEGNLPREAGPDFLIIDFNPDKRQALRIARTLRGLGYAVARDIIKRDLDGSLDYARASAIPRAIILGGPGAPAEGMILKDLASGQEEAWGIDAFCHRVEDGGLAWPT